MSPPPPLTETLEPMLTESIYHFLTQHHNGRTDFSELTSIFFRLIQTMVHPPLEFIWFKADNTEVIGLLDRIVSYIIMCCGDNGEGDGVGECELGVGWVGLVPVWIADRVRESEGRVDGFALFFPLLSEDMRKGIVVGDCGMKWLAAGVMVEVFLFRLCVMFDSGDLCKDVKGCAVQIVQGFKKNSLFLVMLFKMLLELSLPVGNLLATPDELILRRVLYDVALDFGPFLSCDASLDDAQYKEIVVLWLFVANSALQFASENGDHVAVNCYLNAFSASQLPRQIISWVTGGVTSVKPTAPDISSPKDIIGWLLVLEQQGFKICEHSISELRDKALKYSSMGKGNGVKDDQAMVEDAPVSINGRRKRNSSGFWEVQKHIKVIKCCHENLGDDGFCGKTEVVNNSVSDQEMVDMVR
ncbi:hypothetical protein M8C21_023702 [Ambrosia artemisiifolia]|uniref:Uncharacterized protein n=1 Tax=Ambrosia artemisiifolia TaxID=4212 RepID=A0AAD5C7C6_AMBAR|nr:hypothetical protein M8C21_023702 [Ambrosia artemisiifolia]